MCLIRVGRVIQVNKNKALCDFDGVLKEVSSALYPKVKVGNDVVISSGFISDIVKNKKELYKQVVSTDALSTQVVDEIKKYSKIFEDQKIVILNTSDINDYLIEKYSIKELLPKNIKFINSFNLNITNTKEENILVTKESVTEILKEILNLLKRRLDEFI